MAQVSFNELPQAVRTRFVAATRNFTQPPVLAESEYYAGFGFVVALLALGLAALGYQFMSRAELGNPYPRHSVGEVDGMLAASLFVITLCAVAWLCRVVWPAAAWRRGTYMFPGYLVVANDATLEVIPWSSIAGATIVDVRPRRRADYTRLSFLCTSPSGAAELHEFLHSTHAAAQEMLTRIQHAQASFAQAFAAGDRETLGQLDVFFECTTTGRWSEQPATPASPPRVKPRPGWTRALPWLAALLMMAPVAALVLSRQSGERAAERERVKRYQDDRAGKLGTRLDRYRGNAGTPAAETFLQAALAHNDARHKNTICFVVEGAGDENLARIDAELKTNLRAAGDKFIGLGSRDYFRNYQSDFSTADVLDKALGTAVGDASTFDFAHPLPSELEGCPQLKIKAKLSATKQSYKFANFIYGALAVHFTVTSLIPGQPEQPVFDLNVPAPDAAAMQSKAGAAAYSDKVYQANLELIWETFARRLKAHFVKG